LQDLRIQRLSDNGRINLMYHVTPEIISKLKIAKQIGYHLQYLPESATFVGFGGFPFEDGAKKMPGLLDVYFRELDPREQSLRATLNP
jgi:hypothetical protein